MSHEKLTDCPTFSVEVQDGLLFGIFTTWLNTSVQGRNTRFFAFLAPHLHAQPLGTTAMEKDTK